MVKHVAEVNIEWLRSRGIRAIVSDLDNTLVPWKSEDVPGEVQDWIVALRDQGFGVCLASNTRHPERLERLAKRLQIHHVPGNAGKPGVGGLRRALLLLQTAPEETVMVGDQLFTDIVAGNRLGLFTILVNPLTRREFVGTKVVSRNLERLVLRGENQRPDA